jgi:DNA ligase-associated metallophosphoesterase
MEWAGEKLALLPERALWWERESTLFIADPHFGKASAFRYAGIPVPETAHDDDLQRLDVALEKTSARRLIILGDFLHARTGRSEATLTALHFWRSRQAHLEIVLILGNHDRQAGHPPEAWRIESVKGPWLAAPFHCCHEPQEIVDGFVLAGHLHPSLHLSVGSDGVSSPCFHFTERLAVLPAFGVFTGSHSVRASNGDRIFVIGPDEVIDVTAATTGNGPAKGKKKR